MKFINSEFNRFIFFGGVNTLLSYGLYAFFLFFMAYPVAYTVSYILGIFIAFYLNSRFVFKWKIRLTRAFLYPLVYLVQYLLGIFLLYILVEIFTFNELIAPALIILFMIPVTFFLSKFIIKGGMDGIGQPP